MGSIERHMEKRHISQEAKVGMYEGIIEPSLLYGCELWTLKVRERKRMEAVKMNCLRNICGLRRIDRFPNVEIRRCGKNVSESQRIGQGVLRWLGHDERMAKREYESDMRGIRGRGRPKKCWSDGVKEVLARKGLNVQEARVSVQDRNKWRSICRGVSHAVGESPARCMKWPGGWMWKLRSCWGSHPRTMVKNESGTHEFPCFSVGAIPYWEKGLWVKKNIYIYIYMLYVCMYMCVKYEEVNVRFWYELQFPFFITSFESS